MKTFRFCLILTFLAVAQPLMAQTVEVPNALVFYFDEAATQRSWYGTGEVTAYLIAGPLDYQGEPCWLLNSWTCWYMDIWPAQNVTGVALTMRGNAQPAVLFMTDFQLGFTVELLEPLPINGRTVVAELSLTVLSTEPTALEAWGGEFVADGTQNYFYVLTHGSDGPMDMTGHTASINDDAPVSTEVVTWGQVKALYR